MMFKDDKVAAAIKLERDTISHIIVSGIHLFFKKSLPSSIKRCSYFVAEFDESMNKVAAKTSN